MKQIVIGEIAIEVLSLTPYVYDYGKGEKVLKIDVSAEYIGFEALRNALENASESIKYYEEEVLVCEYVGYGKFEAQYKDGIYHVEMHKTSIDEQMSALLVANEKLNKANATLQATTESLTAQNEILAEQNVMLSTTLSEVLETIIPSTIGEIMVMIGTLDERVTALEIKETVVEETVTDETVSE